MKIFVQGFKSIRDGQHIALGRKLTFLVGPNSAGKSVLMLALERLRGESPDFELDKNLIYRNPNQSDQLAGLHSLGVEWVAGNETLVQITSYSFDAVVDEETMHTILNLRGSENIFRGNQNLDKTDIESISVAKSIHKYVNGNIQNLIREDTGVQTHSPIGKAYANGWVYWQMRSMPEVIRGRFMQCDSWQLELVQSDAELFKYICALEEQGILYWDYCLLQHLVEARYKKSGKNLQQQKNKLEHLNSIVQRENKKLDRKFKSSYPGKTFETAVVAAERILPRDEEVRALINLAENYSGIRELLVAGIQEEWGDSIFPQWKMESQAQNNLLHAVNRALRENLFIDNGYQISVQPELLVTRHLWNIRKEKGIDHLGADEKFWVNMALLDAHGRELSFQEVGSGIGYVLPILIESLTEKNKGKTVFLQQPELHLHPALQANLTDVLIEASSDRRIVAETHSEHMILRALKRVRQTSNGSLKDPELALTPEDVAVNYFEPLPDGSTRVHILRIAEDGDFIDRWPKGFFAERDQELFDE